MASFPRPHLQSPKGGPFQPLLYSKNKVKNLLGLSGPDASPRKSGMGGLPWNPTRKEGEWGAWVRITSPTKIQGLLKSYRAFVVWGTGPLHQETLIHLLLWAPSKSSTCPDCPICKKNNDIIFPVKLYLTVILKLGAWKSEQTTN